MKKYAVILALSALALTGCGESDTPTKAYQRLFAAVKSKNTETIKAEMSTKTRSFAEFVAQQQKKPAEEVFANGFTQTTFAETLPEIRDERIKGDMGAVEVWNAKAGKWDDVPFILEGSKWKLAVGDAFGGSWRSPGAGMDAREKESSNSAGRNTMINGLPNVTSKPGSNSGTNTNSNINGN